MPVHASDSVSFAWQLESHRACAVYHNINPWYARGGCAAKDSVLSLRRTITVSQLHCAGLTCYTGDAGGHGLYRGRAPQQSWAQFFMSRPSRRGHICPASRGAEG